MSDFLALLGSRGTVPGEVRSGWGITEYVAALGLDKLDRPRLVERSKLVELVETQPQVVERSQVVERPRSVELVETHDTGRLDRSRLTALLRAMARPPSAELNRARLAAAAGIPATTLPPYVAALQRLGLVRAVPGARAAVAKRAIARPRMVFVDPAMALGLAGVDPATLLQLSGRARLAPLLYGVVANALLDQGLRVTHLRERNGLKVDLLIELPDETVYGIDVRTAAGVRPHQFAALESLAARAGSRFRGGVVLNTAPAGHEFGPGMWSLPISSVWDGVG